MKRALVSALVVIGGLACSATPALASQHSPAMLPSSAAYEKSICNVGCEHLHYAAGPYWVRPGANLILTDYRNVPKPNVNGWMVRVTPNLHYALPGKRCCGGIPRVDVIHLHHGVWLTDGMAGAGEGESYCMQGRLCLYPFLGVGEEKTMFVFPKGYGYPIGANDRWFLNYMIHDLWPKPAWVYITYEIDFIPDSSPAARGMTPIHPIWMDVMDHHFYPVFNVKRYSGVNGKYTFPDMATNPYGGSSSPLNEFTVDHSGTLVSTVGHVHPGGLYTTLDLIRSGVKIARKATRGAEPDSVRLFRSYADYFDKRGPISWDLAMAGTALDWRPHINAGDVLRISTTYNTTRASWYEVMGIMLAWEAWDDQVGLDPFTGKVYRTRGRVASVNPFAHAIDLKGYVTHGHLAENNHHGGTPWLTVNPNKLPSCRTNNVTIGGFTYHPGDLESPGKQRCAPTIEQGQSLTFTNEDAAPGPPGIPGLAPSAAYEESIFHTITSCQDPCGLDTGVSYPLANGAGNFDSGELGDGTPALGYLSWSTPKNLKPGVYTFFCRIHPFMRGVFRVIRN